MLGLAAILILGGCQNMLTTPTYQTFDSKFIDTDRVRAAAAKPIAMADNRRRAPRPNLNAQDIRALSGRPDLIAMTQYLDNAGLVEDPVLESYLNSVADRLLDHWPGQRPKVNIFVRASEDFSPHSSIGDDIFLTLGTLDNLENEHQLAGVLAHELSHILLNHFDREAFLKQQKQSLSAGSTLAILGAALADLRAEGRPGGGFVLQAQQKVSNRNIMLAAVATNLVLTEFADTIVDGTWTRDQENEADLLAVDLMVKADYDPNAFQAVIEKLRIFDENRTTQMLVVEKKFLAAYTAAAEAGNINYMIGNVSGVVVGAGASMLKDLRSLLRRKHMSWDTRIEAIAEYTQREHADQDFDAVAARQDSYDRRINGGRIKAVRENYAATLQATRHLAEGKVDSAEGLAAKGVSGFTADDSYTRYVLSIVQQQRGKRDQSLRNLQYAARSPLAPAAVYTDLAFRYAVLGQGADSIRTLDLGSERFGSEELFYLSYIQIYQALDRDEEAGTYYDRCMASSSKDLKEACAASRKPRPNQAPASSPNILDVLTKAITG
jgi:Zn-dependent protease with chaperone function